MQPCASAAGLRGGGPILQRGLEAIGTLGSPPPRIVISGPPDDRWAGRETVFGVLPRPGPHASGRRTTPSGTSPVVTRRHKAITAWTMLRRAAWATTVIRSGVDAKDDSHLIIVDLDPPDQGADEIAPDGPVRRRQPVPDHPGEALEPTDDQLQRSRPGGGIPQRGSLGLELAGALP